MCDSYAGVAVGCLCRRVDLQWTVPVAYPGILFGEGGPVAYPGILFGEGGFNKFS